MPNKKSGKKDYPETWMPYPAVKRPGKASSPMKKPSRKTAKPKPVSVPGTITTPYAKKPGMGKTTTAAIQNAASKKRSELAAKARQAKARTAASRVAKSGSVTSARAKGKAMGAAAPGVAKAAGVKPYALPKKRARRQPMGAGVPGFKYGQGTI